MFNKLSADVVFLNGEYEKALSMFLEGAEEGNSLAAYNAAYCYLNGIGAECNAALAKSYFSFARDLEGGESCYMLAMLYMHGVGVKKDISRAIRYMKDSAEMGCVEALLYMGMAYTTGCAFEPDIIGISMIPYHKPEYRNSDIRLLEGEILEDAEDDKRYSVVPPSARAAFECFYVAARHDPTYVSDLVARGKYLYAKCYIDGLGTEHDFERGARLMLLAGKSGSQEAINFLQTSGVTPQMLEAATKRKNKTRGGNRF